MPVLISRRFKLLPDTDVLLDVELKSWESQEDLSRDRGVLKTKPDSAVDPKTSRSRPEELSDVKVPV
jgi:hypothetical protein